MELEKNYKFTIKSILTSKFKLKKTELIKKFKIFLFYKKSNMCLIAYIVLLLFLGGNITILYNSYIPYQRTLRGFSVLVENFRFIQKIVLLFLGVSRELVLNFCEHRDRPVLAFPLNYDFTDLFELFTISHVHTDGIEDAFFYLKFDLFFFNMYYYECFFRILRFSIILKRF